MAQENGSLDWTAIFESCPELAPPGYAEAVEQAKIDSAARYERQGKKRAGSSGKSKASKPHRKGSGASGL